MTPLEEAWEKAKQLPTDEEHKAAFRHLYIAAFEDLGIDGLTAGQWFDAVPWDEMKTMTVKEAVREETQYWDDDGDPG
jgi:hypothetical protein